MPHVPQPGGCRHVPGNANRRSLLQSGCITFDLAYIFIPDLNIQFISHRNFSSQVSEEGGFEDKVADLFSDLDDLPQSQSHGVQQGSLSLSQAESVDMFEDTDAEDIDDRVADLFSSNNPSQQMQVGSDFESEPEVESVLSSL